MAAQHIQLLRYAVFRVDGTCAHPAALCWYGSPGLPAPGPLVSAAGPDLYSVSLDDEPDHWRRLFAEDMLAHHDTPAIRARGAVAGLHHAQGQVHPTYPHLQIGGVLTWMHAPHPLVEAHVRRLAALTPLALIQLFAGPLDGGFVA